MPKPPAEFRLYNLYKGKVQIKFFPNSHRFKVFDEEHNRDWEISPSATGLTGKMDKGDGLLFYAMSEAMKYIDRILQQRSLKSLVDDEKFTIKNMFVQARGAGGRKSDLGKSVGTTTHSFVEELLKNLKQAQEKKAQFIVPQSPRALDLATELTQSWNNIVSLYKFDKLETAEKFRAVVTKDIDIRSILWEESLMVQRSCDAARGFFMEAAKAGAIKVWGIEQLVHSREMFVSGYFDAILEFVKEFTWRGYTIPMGVFFTDLKTSNPSTDYPMGIYPNHLAQVGIYDVCYCEEYPEVMDRIRGHLILGSSKHGTGFHPYVSLARERNRNWGKALVPMAEYMHEGEVELKGLNVYGD